MNNIKLKSTLGDTGNSRIDLADSKHESGLFAIVWNDPDGSKGRELVKRWNEHEELVEALMGCSELLRMVTLNRWESVAEQFYKETGFLRPGKDYPAGAGWDDEREAERNAAWKEWSAKRQYETIARISALLAKIGWEDK